MKKLVSLILAIIMLVSCVVSVSAYDPHDPGTPEYEHQRNVEAELLPKLSAHIEGITNKNSVTSVRYLYEGGTQEDKYYLITFTSDDTVEKDIFYRIGVYAVKGNYSFPVFEDGYAVYTVADDTWHPISYLYNVDEFAYNILISHRMYGIGGVNEFDCITSYAGCYLNITTATEIQKYLAGMEVKSSITEETVKYLDVDNDGSVTIKDATTIQKYIAGLEIFVHDSVV